MDPTYEFTDEKFNERALKSEIAAPVALPKTHTNRFIIPKDLRLDYVFALHIRYPLDTLRTTGPFFRFSAKNVRWMIGDTVMPVEVERVEENLWLAQVMIIPSFAANIVLEFPDVYHTLAVELHGFENFWHPEGPPAQISFRHAKNFVELVNKPDE